MSELPALRNVKVGDIIFGIAAGGQPKLLLVYEAGKTEFWTRHVTSQTRVRFGRDGQSRWAEGGGTCNIVSTAKLPPEMYEVAVGLDRKFAAQPEYPNSKLTKDEIQFVLNHDKFFKAHLLPGTDSIVKQVDKINAVRAVLQLEWDRVDVPKNAPDWNQYLDDLPALVELLEMSASVEAIAVFLAEMARRSNRLLQVAGRGDATAISLVRLRQNWT